MALAVGEKGLIALLSPVFIISVLSPIVLIVLAHLRGKRIGNSKLLWFPITAVGLTLLPVLFGLLGKLLSGYGNVRSVESFGIYATMFVAIASTLGPLILHTICCVVGGKRDPVPIIGSSPSISSSAPTKSGAMYAWKFIAVLVFFSLIGGYYYSTRTEKIHWIEDAEMQDGRKLTVQRTVALKNTHYRSPQYYSFKVYHPDTGKPIEWHGDYGYAPILVDFFDKVPYLVILQSDVFANLKKYGCPDIPYVFFRYNMNKNNWEQVSSLLLPSALSHANLTASYDAFYTRKGVRFSKEDIELRNNDLEGGETGGYFTKAIPKDFNSWTYKSKDRVKKGHYRDGCRPAQEVIPIQPTAQQVNLEVVEKKDFEPEWVINKAGESASQWLTLSWDKKRSEMCKTLLRPEDPQVHGWYFFINDPSRLKKIHVMGILICDIDVVWVFDYVVEKGRVVVAKYKSNGDLAYRVSFKKPDEPGWYQGGIMQPSLKVENGYLFFDWWNLNHTGHDVHVRRSMKVKIQEP